MKKIVNIDDVLSLDPYTSDELTQIQEISAARTYLQNNRLQINGCNCSHYIAQNLLLVNKGDAGVWFSGLIDDDKTFQEYVYNEVRGGFFKEE